MRRWLRIIRMKNSNQKSSSLNEYGCRMKIILLLMMHMCFSAKAIGKVKIDRTETPYTDWATGMHRTKVDFQLHFDQFSLGFNDVKKLINAQHPGLLEAPTIYDAVQLAQDDILLIVSRDSQGEPYPILRVHFQNKILEAELIELGGIGSPYNWFPDSRLPGWVRAIGADGQNYLIRSTETIRRLQLISGISPDAAHPQPR